MTTTELATVAYAELLDQVIAEAIAKPEVVPGVIADVWLAGASSPVIQYMAKLKLVGDIESARRAHVRTLELAAMRAQAEADKVAREAAIKARAEAELAAEAARKAEYEAEHAERTKRRRSAPRYMCPVCNKRVIEEDRRKHENWHANRAERELREQQYHTYVQSFCRDFSADPIHAYVSDFTQTRKELEAHLSEFKQYLGERFESWYSEWSVKFNLLPAVQATFACDMGQDEISSVAPFSLVLESLIEINNQKVELATLQKLLPERFKTGDGRTVTWGEATVTDHEMVAERLHKMAAGDLRTASLHKAAARLIRDNAVACLADIAATRV